MAELAILLRVFGLKCLARICVSLAVTGDELVPRPDVAVSGGPARGSKSGSVASALTLNLNQQSGASEWQQCSRYPPQITRR